jgi:MFS family permease
VALLSSNSVAIVVAAAGPAQRGRALGIQSPAQAVELSAGPAIGCLVLDVLDWRWVFWINVPVGLAGTVLGWFVLPPTKDLPDDGRFDWKGAFLIAPALTALIAVLNEGYAWGNVAGARRMRAAGSDPADAVRSLRKARRSPTHRPHAVSAKRVHGWQYRRPDVLRGAVRTVLSDAVHIRAPYRDSTFAAGLRLTIVPVMLGAVAPLGGALYDRLGPRVFTVFICIAALALLFATLDGACR